MTKKLFILFFVLYSSVLFSQSKGILYWADLLQRNVTSDNTSYFHNTPIVTWAGIDGAEKYECRATCSSFLSDLIKKTYGIDQAELNKWFNTKNKTHAKDFYDQIIKENKFKKITNINDALTGDIIAIKFPKLMDNTGHVMVISETPVLIEDSKPVISGTKQWKVKVIDESAHPHGFSDSRYAGNKKFSTGLGTGYFRIYTDDSGEISGYCWSTEVSSKYQKADSRKIVIGRILM